MRFPGRGQSCLLQVAPLPRSSGLVSGDGPCERRLVDQPPLADAGRHRAPDHLEDARVLTSEASRHPEEPPDGDRGLVNEDRPLLAVAEEVSCVAKDAAVENL